VYAYEFDDRGAPAPDSFRKLPFPVGASHSLELRYLFDVGGASALSPDQQVLSDQMVDAWSQFVREGHPGVDWPAFDAQEKRLSLRPDGSRVDTDFDNTRQCPFWAGLKE
nr:carboxylesterase family protein [Actinomycetota bacterium]